MNARSILKRVRHCPPGASLALVVSLLALAGLLTVVAAEAPQPMHAADRIPLHQDGNYGGNFRYAEVEPDTLDPADENSVWEIDGQMFEGLTKWNDDLAPVPGMAHSWESSDAQHWTFQLRPGARFHNGRQVTAQDVVYSWDRVAAAGYMSYDYLVDPLLDTATAEGSDTVEVTLTEPFAPFPLILALPFMSIVPSETVGTIVTAPVGSGPFQFQSWTAGDSIVLTYFDDYYDNRPFLDSVTYQFYSDESEMYEDYLLGNLDLSPVPADRIAEVLGNPNAIPINLLGLYYYGMKVDREPFDDPVVRRALNYAVDRQGIVDGPASGYRNGFQFVAEGPVPPGLQGYDPPVPAYSYNPTQTLDLLAQAGWTDTNHDGILDDGAGTDLEVEMWYGTRFPQDEAIANALAGDLRDIGGTGLGATVVVSYTDWSTYIDNWDQYPMYALTWFIDYPDPYDMLEPHFGTESGMNYANYSNGQVDAWLDQSLATLDLTARQALYEGIETQVQNDAPFINLFYMGTVYVQSENVAGLVMSSHFGAGAQMERVQLFFDTHDVEPQSILYPKSNALIGPVAPTVRVRNAGSSDETDVPVRCRILLGSTELYSETEIIDNLSPFAIQVIAFPAWTPPEAGDYAFEFTTLLPGDENPANDQEATVVTITDVAFYDAYTRDNGGDNGAVPTAAWWQSPDIVVRHADDGIRSQQEPILGQTNYVYIRVRNIGNATISDGYANVYWHSPSAAIICGDWGLINAEPIPIGTLAPSESKWVMTTWVPPIEGHTCLFSRFWSSEDPVSFECDVPWDNNIAQRNVQVVELEEGALLAAMDTGRASVLFEVTNIRPMPASVDLIVERGSFPTTGTLEVEFSHDLFSRWQAEGAVVQGGAVLPGTTRISVTHPISATIVGLPMGVRETQQARIHLSGPPAIESELGVKERIEGIVVGGMTFRTEIPWAIYLPLVIRDW